MDKKEKSKGQNNIFLVLLIVLMTVAVVVAIAGAIAGNLTEKEPHKTPINEETTDDTSALRENKVQKSDDKEKETSIDTVNEDLPEETEKDDEKKEDAVAIEETIPQFIAPAEGKVLKTHSAEVPVFSMTMEDYRTHSGVDIYADPQSTVIAAADGTVQEIWDDPMMGNCLSIAHSGGAITVYKNLSDEFPEGIEAGKEVHAGDVIATVGDSALEEVSEESHLHFEMSVDGVPVDPELYVKFMNEETYTE